MDTQNSSLKLVRNTNSMQEAPGEPSSSPSTWRSFAPALATVAIILLYAGLVLSTSTDGDLGITDIAEDMSDEITGIGYYAVRIGVTLAGIGVILGVAQVQSVIIRIVLGAFLIVGGYAAITNSVGSGTLL